MIFQDTVPPFGATPNQLFTLYFEDLLRKSDSNISSLYRLDAFDWTVLVLYFGILFVLSVYGIYRIKQVIEFWRYRHIVPEPKGHFTEDQLPHITVQLPLFNEMYVVE